MKNFFKNKTWDDWLLVIVGVMIIFSLLLFFIGYMWSFDILENTKTNVRKVIKSHNTSNTLEVLLNLFDPNLNTKDLFTLSRSLDPNTLGVEQLYSMVALSVAGFSMLMISFSSIIIMLMSMTVWEKFILPIIQKRK